MRLNKIESIRLKLQNNQSSIGTWQQIPHASISEIQKCGLGYRSKAVLNASMLVVDGKIDFELLKKMNYYEAKNELKQVFGIEIR